MAGLVATAQDMLIFLQALNEGRIIHRETLALMHRWHSMQSPICWTATSSHVCASAGVRRHEDPRVCAGVGSLGIYRFVSLFCAGTGPDVSGTIDQTASRIKPSVVMCGESCGPSKRLGQPGRTAALIDPGRARMPISRGTGKSHATFRRDRTGSPARLRPLSTQGLLDAGAESVAGYNPDTTDPRVLAGFRKRFPTGPRRQQTALLLDDPSIDFVVIAAVPRDRADLAIAAMQRGKDVLVRQARRSPVSLEQLQADGAGARWRRRDASGRSRSAASSCLVDAQLEALLALVRSGAIGRLVQTTSNSVRTG